ncbi:unnamed protein product [Boreogadus saida]
MQNMNESTPDFPSEETSDAKSHAYQVPMTTREPAPLPEENEQIDEEEQIRYANPFSDHRSCEHVMTETSMHDA